MQTRQSRSYQLAAAALIAAAYTAFSLALTPLAFGPVQIRFSEALTLLAVFSPAAIWGVTLGCALTNAVGVALGLVLPPDIVVGTLATLLAALASWKLRKVRFRGLPVAAALLPVAFNALLVGAELTWMFYPMEPRFFLFNAFTVGLGELVACGALGLPLVWALERKGLAQKLFGVQPS